MRSFFRNHIVRKHVHQLMKFAMMGGSAAIIDFGILNGLVKLADWSPRVAVIPSILISATYVFLMNRTFTFKSKNKKKGMEAMKFALVYGCAILFNYFLFRFFLGILEPYEVLLPFTQSYNYAKALAIAIVAVWNYTLSHFFVFKRKL